MLKLGSIQADWIFGLCNLYAASAITTTLYFILTICSRCTFTNSKLCKQKFVRRSSSLVSSSAIKNRESFQKHFQRPFFFLSRKQDYPTELQKRKWILNAEPLGALHLFVMPRYVSVLFVVWNTELFIFKLTSTGMQFDGGRGLLKAILATKIADHIQIPLQNF